MSLHFRDKAAECKHFAQVQVNDLSLYSLFTNSVNTAVEDYQISQAWQICP